jgi:hypothetical protein
MEKPRWRSKRNLGIFEGRYIQSNPSISDEIEPLVEGRCKCR